MNEHEIEQVTDKAVECTLTRLGFDLSDPISIQADMHFLRAARRLAGAAVTKIVMVLIGVVTLAAVTGVCVAVGKAIKQAVTS